MEHPLITASPKTDFNNEEPFDAILQTIINSVTSLQTSHKDVDSIDPRNNLYNGLNAEKDPSRRKGVMQNSLKNRDNSQLSPNNGKAYPNFWPQSSSIVPEFSLSTKIYEHGESRRRRLISKSANKSTRNGTICSFNRITPKTTKPKKAEVKPDDWMQVLQERSNSAISTKNVEKEEDHNFGIIDDDGASSFMTDFPPRGIFTAGSSDATSIGWADDAIESESTDILARQWAQVEQVFHGENEGNKPEEMSDLVYQEVILWRDAFNSKSKRNYNFNRNAKMSISLHIDRDLNNTTTSNKSLLHHHEYHSSVNYFDFPTPTSLLTEFDSTDCPAFRGDSSNSPSYSLQRQTSAFSDYRENLNLHLPSSLEETKGTSFVQSWLENLTTNYGDSYFPGGDQYHLHPTIKEEEQPLSLPAQQVDLEIFNNEFDEEDLPVTRRHNSGKPFKVQRPISSQYLNRSWTKDGGGKSEINRSRSRTVPKLSLDIDLNGSGDCNSAYFDNRNKATNRCLSTTSHVASEFAPTLNKSTTGIHQPRKQSAWSRHAHRDDEDLDGNKEQQLDDARNPRKNFISWLLFDENDENLAQGRDDYSLDNNS